MSRQRMCILSLVETSAIPAASGVPAASGIPGAASHGAANVLLSRTLVLDAPYDPLFKDVMKATPGARFNGTTKTWDVNLLGAASNFVQNVLQYLTGPVFLAGARDRQFDVAVNFDLCAFAATALAGGPLPTLYDWAGAHVGISGRRDIACRDITALLADMGLNPGPAPVPVPVPSGYQHRRSNRFPTVPQVPVNPQTPHAPMALPTPPPPAPTPDPTESESEMTEADEVRLAGSYGDMDRPSRRRVRRRVHGARRRHAADPGGRAHSVCAPARGIGTHRRRDQPRHGRRSGASYHCP
jgi:hypothetical protein